jgi:hypothetical protein
MSDKLKQALNKLNTENIQINFGTSGKDFGNTGYGESQYDAPNMASQDINEGLFNKQRYEQQGALDVLGLSVGNLITNVGLGLVETTGYLLDLESHINTLSGKGGDYNNLLTEFAKNNHDLFGDIYEEEPGTVNTSDPMWWVNGGRGLIESAIEFALTGYGVGSMLGKGAKVLGTALKSTKTAKGLKLGSQIITNAELAYLEGAMTGKEVFDNTYNLAIKQGKSEYEARLLAGKSAAETVRINTAVNTFLNVPQTAAVFREINYAKPLSKQFQRLPNENLGSYISRLKEYGVGKTLLKKIGKEHLIDIPLEATEEIVNQYAEDMGMQYFNNTMFPNDKKSWDEVLTETLSKDETWAAAMWGAIGGPAQSIMMNAIPSVRKNKAKEEDRIKDQVKELISYLESFQDAQLRLSKHAKDGNEAEYKKAQNDLFALETYNNITRGTSEQLLHEYESIGKLSKEEAELQGFNVDPESDNYYKKLSINKVSDIKHLTQKFDDFMNKYGYDEDLVSTGFPNILFSHYISIYNNKQNVDSFYKKLKQVEAEFNQNKILANKSIIKRV